MGKDLFQAFAVYYLAVKAVLQIFKMTFLGMVNTLLPRCNHPIICVFQSIILHLPGARIS